MHTAIIIDDEAKGRLALKEKLREWCPQVQLLAEAASGREAIVAIKAHHPEIVFLDIEMPGMSGFDMLNKIDDKDFHIIFTTAYNQYAIKAIKYAAFDYLLKPVDVEELKLAVAKLGGITKEKTKMQAALLLENLNHPAKLLNKIALPTINGLLFFDINHIIHLEAQSNYTIIYFADKSKVTASKTLKEFEEMLPANTFFRTHHSHIINLNFIKKYFKGDGGQIELNNGALIDVSRSKKEEFLNIIR